MRKLFQPSYAYLQFRVHKTPALFSHLHGASDALDPNSKRRFLINEAEELQTSNPRRQITQPLARIDESIDNNGLSAGVNESSLPISHPWPEWVDLMEFLLKRGYFVDENPFENDDLGLKESNLIRTACLNFARDHYGLMRYFSRKHIQVIAGCGCPSIDRKVVNSGKRLRAHVGVDEGNVCSSCNLRGNCERAFVKAREEEGGRTVDLMRILLTYGLDHITGSVENKPCQNKVVKESVRRLLKQMVDYGSKEANPGLIDAASSRNPSVQDHLCAEGHIKVPTKPGDWRCPKCQFLNFARNIRCKRCDGLFQERLKQLQEDQEHLPLKKGDWICDKCNFLNFARNTKCLQCKENPPKRHLNPGEWECESCNYLNFRRNMVCLKCDHKRPRALNATSEYEHKHSRDADKWRFVNEQNEDKDYSMTSDEESKFIDFPIAGGRSNISRNPEMKEKWRLDMSKRSRTPTTIDNDESRHQRKLELLESTDDEEMADWFRP